jgi:PAS domain S-box-containing protein
MEEQGHVQRDDAGRMTGIIGVVRDITERKQVETALRESEARFRSLFERVPVGIYRTGPDGQFLDANHAFVEMLRYPSRESLLAVPAGSTYADPRDRQRWQETLQREGTVRDFEVQGLCHDGTIIWVRDSARVVRDEQGNVLYYEGSVEDITEQKEAAAALYDALAQLRELASIINRSPAVVFLWRVAEGWPVEFVTENVEHFGYTADDFTSGRVSWPGITHPEDAPRLETEVAHHFVEGRTEFEQHYRLITKSGEVRWVEDRKRILRSARGKPTHIQGIVLDVTQRREAEEALRDREERLRLMIEQVPAILWTTDRDLRVTSASGAGFTALGRRPEEFIGDNLKDVLGVDGGEHAAIPAHHRALAGESVGYEDQYGGMSYESHVEPLRDASGRTVGVIGVGLDVTEHRRLEEEILRVRDAQRRRIGQDLHDSVGQQLTGLLFALAALHRRLGAQELPEADDVREAQDIVTALGDEVRSLARGLCPVAVEEEGLMGALDALARETRDRFGMACTLHCQCAVRVKDSVAATHLYRIAQEAVSNAARHGEADAVELVLSAENGKLTLCVADDGRGLPPDWQLREGLGLEGIRYRARRLGGAAQLQPAANGGTRLVCTVPYPQAPTPREPREGNGHDKTPQQPTGTEDQDGPPRG